MQLKLKHLVVAACAMTAAAPAANAALIADFYASGALGFGRERVWDGNFADNTSAQSYAAALGVDLPIVRVEGEYNYLNGQDVGLHVGMLNAYLKPFPFPLVKPYIGAGFGSVFGGEIYNMDVKTTTAFQGMAGIQVGLPGTGTSIDIEGRALYAPDIYEISMINFKPDFLHYELRAKLRYTF